MHAELVYDGGTHTRYGQFGKVQVPSMMGLPRDDQMKGTAAECLIEVAGRCCYDSMGTGRPSGEYHRNLLIQQRHYSVAEHYHVTVKTALDVTPWLGIPDTHFHFTGPVLCTPTGNAPEVEVTFNLRHVLEWSVCVTANADPYCVDQWKRVLDQVGQIKLPSLPWPDRPATRWEFVEPHLDSQAHVSLFLEDSLVWALEQNRHRGNISQRSGRFVDQTDRPMSVHPYVREYLDEAGALPERTNKGLTVYAGATINTEESALRWRLSNRNGQLITDSRMLYANWVDVLQPWLEKKGLDKVTARKQARSAARYYLPNGLSTEGVYTYSIRHWRHIFGMRISSHADAAIHELTDKARSIVKASRYGNLL